MPATTDGLILLFLSTFFIVGNTQSTCRPTGSDGVPVCCPYYYIKDNICVGCQAGYRVLLDPYSCSDPCEFPDYGARCSGRCGCSKEDCHHVHGCPVTTHRPLEDDQQRLCFRCVVVGVGIVLIVIMMIINVVNVKALRRRTRKTNKNTQPVV
uniref:Uncharacterized protein LOC111099084 isoform X2 n=1 Tax=Crassostrea virginica TaxID=6565 RepID=A0A8B8A3V4_CRAVI|nr:uncharacterized protein LOC111099084 isoform X2 [Crassostrea virginica]